MPKRAKICDDDSFASDTQMIALVAEENDSNDESDRRNGSGNNEKQRLFPAAA